MKKAEAVAYILDLLSTDCPLVCMDDPRDKEEMAEWIYDHFRL